MEGAEEEGDKEAVGDNLRKKREKLGEVDDEFRRLKDKWEKLDEEIKVEDDEWSKIKFLEGGASEERVVPAGSEAGGEPELRGLSRDVEGAEEESEERVVPAGSWRGRGSEEVEPREDAGEETLSRESVVEEGKGIFSIFKGLFGKKKVAGGGTAPPEEAPPQSGTEALSKPEASAKKVAGGGTAPPEEAPPQSGTEALSKPEASPGKGVGPPSISHINQIPKEEAIKILRGEKHLHEERDVEEKPALPAGEASREDVGGGVKPPVESGILETVEGSEEKPLEKKISKKRVFNDLLRNLERKARDVNGSAIVTRDGLIISSRLPADLDLNSFGGFTASFFGAAETAIYEIKKTQLYDVYIESDEAKIIAVSASDHAFLVTIVRLDANTGLILMEMRNSAEDVRKVMES